MLSALWNLSVIDPADDVSTINLVYEKRSDDKSDALYRNQANVVAPELPIDQISLKYTEAKPSSNFYGTRRNTLAFRFDALKATPTGDRVLPAVWNITTSIPIGFTSIEIEYQKRLLSEILKSDNAADFFKYQRI